MRYRLDRRVEVLDGGRALLGGDPTRLLRLSAAGARFVAGGEFEPSTTAHQTLVDRLVDASMAHPEPEPVDVGDLVVVVPVRDRPEALDRCLAALAGSGATRIVVVDDGSVDAAAHAAVAARHGAHLVRRERSGGPAAARMTGWRALDPRPEFVAFVDSDVTLERWGALLGHFSAPRCGLVAPRVVHRAGEGTVDRYEAVASPLDLGPDPAPIRAGTRVSYVPAAALVVRATAFDQVGGFDETLDVGEDVDLLWRLADAGWRCRYEPAAVVVHAGRSRLPELLRRRFDYGRSAALLDARHPGRLPPVRGSRWSVAVTALAATGHPVLAAAVTAGNAAGLARKIADRQLAVRLVVRGHLGFARQVARALIRPWFPLTFVVGARSRRARRLAVLGALVHPLVERRPVALSLLDDAAYSAGVWVGCLRARRAGPLRPEIGGIRQN